MVLEVDIRMLSSVQRLSSQTIGDLVTFLHDVSNFSINCVNRRIVVGRDPPHS